MTYPGEQSCTSQHPGKRGDHGTQEVLHPKEGQAPARQLCCTAGRCWHQPCHASPRDCPSLTPHVSQGALPQQDES